VGVADPVPEHGTLTADIASLSQSKPPRTTPRRTGKQQF
jgi:hypothetical protein